MPLRAFVENPPALAYGVRRDCENRKGPEVDRRKRLEKMIDGQRRWGAAFGADDLERKADEICGCAGKYNCDCISVFNRALSDLWCEQNTRLTVIS